MVYSLQPVNVVRRTGKPNCNPRTQIYIPLVCGSRAEMGAVGAWELWGGGCASVVVCSTSTFRVIHSSTPWKHTKPFCDVPHMLKLCENNAERNKPSQNPKSNCTMSVCDVRMQGRRNIEAPHMRSFLPQNLCAL